MIQPKVGDLVRWLSAEGIVKFVVDGGDNVFIKRHDGRAGKAWEGTAYEGLWQIPVDRDLVIICTYELENE